MRYDDTRYDGKQHFECTSKIHSATGATGKTDIVKMKGHPWKGVIINLQPNFHLLQKN